MPIAQPEDYIPVDAIEFGARDEFPETFDALTRSPLFGPDGLQRRKSLVMVRLYGKVLDDTEIAVLDVRVQDYISKLIVRTMINPGIDYWSKQVISQSAGTTEQVSYAADRANDLRDLDKRLATELGDLLGDVEAILPPVKLAAGSGPRVGQAGALGTEGGLDGMYTPDPFDLPPVYAPPDTGTTTGA